MEIDSDEEVRYGYLEVRAQEQFNIVEKVALVIQKPSFLEVLLQYNSSKHMSNAVFPPFFYQGQLILASEGSLGEVWLSGVPFARDVGKLSDKQISTVISAAQLQLQFPHTISHHTFNLKDREDQQIRNTFYPVIRLVEQQRKKGNVLIHCAAGVSRSASLLIAYMMHKYQGSFENCLLFLMKRRACVMPNRGFTKQLKEFAKDLGVTGKALSLQ